MIFLARLVQVLVQNTRETTPFSLGVFLTLCRYSCMKLLPLLKMLTGWLVRCLIQYLECHYTIEGLEQLTGYQMLHRQINQLDGDLVYLQCINQREFTEVDGEVICHHFMMWRQIVRLDGEQIYQLLQECLVMSINIIESWARDSEHLPRGCLGIRALLRLIPGATFLHLEGFRVINCVGVIKDGQHTTTNNEWQYIILIDEIVCAARVYYAIYLYWRYISFFFIL